MKPRKYKALKGAVQSFTEGFTGIISSGFQELGRYAMTTGQSHFTFDMLSKSSRPDVSSEKWYAWLMDYIEVDKWLTSVGCAIDYVTIFRIDIQFILDEPYDTEWRRGLPFESLTVIKDDRGKLYQHNGGGCAWID